MTTKIEAGKAYHIYAKKPGEKKARAIAKSIWGIRAAGNLIEADIFEVINAGDRLAFIEYLEWLNDGACEYTFEAREVKGWRRKNE